jgi:PAS domain S-box-containing protein
MLEDIQLFRLLIDSAEEYAIVGLGADGRVVRWNAGAERMKGYVAASILDRHFSVFYSAADKAAGKPARALEIAAREGRMEDEGWQVRNDGSYFWAHTIITTIYDQNRSLAGFGIVTRDLTARRVAEAQALRLEELSTALRAATESSRAKTEFLSVMSRELRTPLNAIAGYSELLRMGVRGPITTTQAEDLDRIMSSGRSLVSLIDDVLDFARIEAGQIDDVWAAVDVQELLTGLEATVFPLLRAKSLTFDYEHQEPALIALADPRKVRQIMLHLFANAITFTPEGGRITLRAWGDQSTVRVSVSDTGIGIPPDKREKIFEPFVQLGRTLTSEGRGSGLGLAIARQLARAMDGDILVESTVDAGSTFTLLLRRADGQRSMNLE